jgi:prevent-host-death family protein
MKARSLADVKARLSEYVSNCRNEPVLITKKGKPAALLLPVEEDTDLEDLVLVNSPKFRAILQRSEEQIARGEAVPAAEAWQIIAKRAEGRKQGGSKRKPVRRRAAHNSARKA